MSTFTSGSVYGVNFDNFNIVGLLQDTIASESSTKVVVTDDMGNTINFTGQNITYDNQGNITGGTLNDISESNASTLLFHVTGFSVTASQFLSWVSTNNELSAEQTILSGPDIVFGSPANDIIRTFGGDDIIHASGGVDLIDGGAGTDTFILTGPKASYNLGIDSNGHWVLQDNRPGAPDGTNTLISIESLQFADQALNLTAPPSATTIAMIDTAFNSVLRVAATAPSAAGSVGDLLRIGGMIDAGSATVGQLDAAVAHAAAGTTSVAVIAYQYFTGSTPSSAGLDYLISPTGPNLNNLNAAYYQHFNTENRYINFAVNLGKVGAGAANFQAQYGSLSLTDATTQAYTTLFGEVPTAAKVATLLNTLVPDGLGGQETRAQYFAFYGLDGPNGIGTKAAMVGWLMSQGVQSDVGTYATANDAYLADVASGHAVFSVNLIGTYHGTPYTGT